MSGRGNSTIHTDSIAGISMASVDAEVSSPRLSLSTGSLTSFSFQEQSATMSLSVPTGPSTTNDEVMLVGPGEIRIVEAEHQVSDSLHNIGLAESVETSTIPGLVPPAAIIENAPFEADKANAIAGPLETDPEGSDEELWDPLDESLFGEGPNEKLTAGESFGEIVPRPSAIPSAGAAPKTAPGPSTELSSRPLAVSTQATAVEEGTGSPANPSLPIVGAPSPATLETAIGSQTDTSLTVTVNAIASSMATETPSSLAPSTPNSAQSPPSLTQLQSTLVPASSSLLASAIVDASSSTHVATVSASAATANSPLSSTSTTTATEPSVFSSCNLGWPSLPLEVREEVYKRLLLVDMRQERRDLSCHHLHLDILRVNRQTYREASEILYLRNTWVQINMSPELGQYIESRINNLAYPKAEAPIELRSVEFSGIAALNIVVNNKEKKNLPRHTYIVSSFAMPQICRALTMPPMRTEGVSLELKLDLATAPKGAMWDQKGLLDCFVETRGLEALKYTKRVAMLAECRGKDGLAQLGAIALPLNDPVVVMERASTYLDRCRQAVRARHFDEAMLIFEGLSDYNHWVALNPYGMSSSAMVNLGIGTRLEDYWWDLFEELVSHCMQLGVVNLAGDSPLSLFRRSGGCRTDNWAEAHYTMGLIEEARGAENSAAHEFLMALCSTPGHEATNKAVDRLRERVRDKTDIKSVIVRHNIDNVLKPFRHRTTDQAPPRSIVEKFVRKPHELDPLT